MTRPCKELKRTARANLTGHYTAAMGALLAAGLIPLAIELPFSMILGEHPTVMQTVIYYVAEFLIMLISYVLSVGIVYLHLNMARQKPYSWKMVFFGFKNRTDRFILAGLLLYGIALASLIPAIIGIVLVLYAESILNYIILAVLFVISAVLFIVLMLCTSLMTYYLIDYPDMGIIACLKNSFHSMKGHKGRLFYINLSFIGLELLSVLTFGIGQLWIAPYESQTFANFYLDVTGETVHTDDYTPFNQYI